jgi:hypothetical protein
MSIARYVLALGCIAAPLGAQAVGQFSGRVIVTQDNATKVRGLGLVGTYGVTQYGNIELGVAGGVVRAAHAYSRSAGVNAVYVIPKWAKITPYVGIELDENWLGGTREPSTVLFAGFSLNRLGHMRKSRGAEFPQSYIVELRGGAIRHNGRYTELDLGYAP